MDGSIDSPNNMCMHHAPCPMHHAPCPMHHAPCTRKSHVHVETARPACDVTEVLVAQRSCNFLYQSAAAWTQGWGNLEEASDGAFLEWVGRSQLYSGDVLAPEALQDLTGWMAEAAPGDKRRMMALLRDLHATISPTGYAPALPCCCPKRNAQIPECPESSCMC